MFTASIRHYAKQSEEQNYLIQDIFQMTEEKFKQLKVKFELNKDEKGKSRGESIPKLDKV